MTRWLLIPITLSAVVILAGCGGSNQGNQSQQVMNLQATIAAQQHQLQGSATPGTTSSTPVRPGTNVPSPIPAVVLRLMLYRGFTAKPYQAFAAKEYQPFTAKVYQADRAG